MEEFEFERGAVLLEGAAATREAIRAFVERSLERFAARLPAPGAGRVLIKPNLNNDLTALTGNSTDLRLLAALLGALKDRGHDDLAVADGSNMGIARTGASVLDRLGVTALARRFGAQAIDLNAAPGAPLPVDPWVAEGRKVERTGRRPEVARVLLEAAAIVNVAKAKTHAEATLTLATKNLVGCLRGESKRWLHEDLHERIVSLHRRLTPALHLIDGLFAMEGNGPGDGVPRRLDLLFAGDDPFLLDGVAARTLGFEPASVPVLAIGRRDGLVSAADWARLDGVTARCRLEPAPAPSRAARLLSSEVTLPVRKALRAVIDARPVREAFYGLGLVQDVYSAEDAEVTIAFRPDRCAGEGRCVALCPVELSMNQPGFDFAGAGCVKCLYCVQACPNQAYVLEGTLGHLARQQEKYGAAIRALTPPGADPVSRRGGRDRTG